MTHRTPEASQRLAARIAGVTLLLLIATGIGGSAVGPDHILVSGDAAATARNIFAHPLRIRIGYALEVVMLNCDVILALALYALLKPINATVALLGSFWRVANATMLGVGVTFILAALDCLGGAHFLKTFSLDQLQTLAMFFINMHETGSLVGMVFFSLGAAVHSYLLLKSAYIPKALSGFYLVAVTWLLLCCFGFIVAPDSMKLLSTAFILPDFIAELMVALWLTIKDANIPSALPAPPHPSPIQ